MSRAMILGMIGAIMIAVVSGCGNKDTRDFSIESHEWEFSNMIDSEAGVVTACVADEKDLYPDAEVMNLTCEASTNVMAICNEGKNGAEISYRAVSKDTNSIVYELVYVDGAETLEGMAVSGITEYEKGKYEHTLVVDIGGYALYFTGRIDEE